MHTKVMRFNEYTKEDAYKINSEGDVEKKDYEVYKDVYPNKYCERDSQNDPEALFHSEFVWVIKYKDKKIAVLEGDAFDEESINELINNIENKQLNENL